MGKVELAAQPEMETLLASIKKAIHEETGGALRGTITGAEPEHAVFGGSMREMRVRMSDERSIGESATSGEILDLRNKIATQLTQRDPAERQNLAPNPAVAPPPSRPGGFAGLLSGTARPAEPAAARRIADPIREKTFATQRGAAGSLSEHDYPTLEPAREPPRHAPREDWDRSPPQEYLPAADLSPARAPARTYGDPGMLSGEATAAASAAFGRLSDTLMSRALNDRPIEDVAKELLRGMLKQWLDDNLPDMVERLVREEIARVARRGGR